MIETGSEDAVSIRGVAHRVGKTSPSIYLHFEDKGELMYAVCERQFARLAEVSAAAQEGLDDPVERIRACAHAYVGFALDHPEVYRILFMDPRETPEGHRSMEEIKQDVAFRSLHDNVVAAFEQGLLLGTRGPDLAALVMWTSVHGLASLLVAKPELEWPPANVLTDEMLDHSIEGLRARIE